MSNARRYGLKPLWTLAAALATTVCGKDSTGPDTAILGNRVTVAGDGYGAAISVNSVAYITMPVANTLARADLPSQTFTPVSSNGSTPTEVAFNSTGTRLYVTNQSSGTITVMNVATNEVIDTIPVGNRPFEVIVQSGDSILWTGKIDSLYGIRLATKAIIARFQVGNVGNGLAIARDTLLYVSTHSTGTIVEINLRTRTRGRTFVVGGTPQKLVVSPTGNELYIANEAGYVQFWNLNTGAQIGENILLPASAYGLALRPTTGMLYVTTFYAGGGVHVIDPAQHAVIDGVVAGGDTRRVVFGANGAGFVPNGDGWVDFIK